MSRLRKNLNMHGKLQIAGAIGELKLKGNPAPDWAEIEAILRERIPDWETRFFLSEKDFIRYMDRVSSAPAEAR